LTIITTVRPTTADYPLEFQRESLVSQADVDAYDRDGFLVISDAVAPTTLEILKEKAEPFAEAPDYPVVLNIHRKQRIFGELMLHPIIIEAMEKLQRSPIYGLTSQYLFKRAGSTYGRQSWVPHQDNAYPKAEQGAYTILHLSIEASDAENGGLVFWPGSHVEPILDYNYKHSWRETVDDDGVARPGWEIRDLPEKYKPIDVTLPAGSLCVMHGHLIHASRPNFSETRSRPQYSMAFLNQGSSYFRGKTSVKQPFTRRELEAMPPEATEFKVN
jgi:ectoine hydroxylase-related dioxygenase (phytanoyl-CoA dioxygenase family)